MRFTDVHLSRIISAHEAGQLVREGQYWCADSDDLIPPATGGCVIQVAFLTQTVKMTVDENIGIYDNSWSVGVIWFDATNQVEEAK